MPTTTNYGWTTPADTDLVKDGAAAIRTLGSSIDSTLKTQIDAQIPKSLVTTKGDLIVATGSGTIVRQGIGANGTVLVADSAEADGLKWALPASGGMTLLSTTTLSGTSTTISSINQDYTNLQVVLHGVNMSAEASLRITPGQGTNIMYYPRFTTSDTFQAVVGNLLFLSANGANLTGGRTDNAFTINIQNYASAFRKTFTGSGGGYNTSITDLFPALYGGIINATSAITSLVISNSAGATFNAGTVLIYGVK